MQKLKKKKFVDGGGRVPKSYAFDMQHVSVRTCYYCKNSENFIEFTHVLYVKYTQIIYITCQF